MKTSVKNSIIPPRGPVRRFAVVGLLRAVATGLFISGSALFFTRVVGLSVVQVGFGLSLAAAAGLVTIVPIGRLADRYGGKPLYTFLLILQAAAMASYIFVDSYAVFLGVAILWGIAERGSAGAIGSLVDAIGTNGTDRVLVRSYLRSTGNLGLSFGALLAGAALYADTVFAYSLLIVGTAVMLLSATLVLRTLHITPPAPQPADPEHAPRFGRALRDGRYLALTAVSSLSSIQYHILVFAIPLWIADWTAAPRWTISAVFVINTVLVVFFQVRAGNLARTVTGAARTAAVGGAVLAVACLLIPLSTTASAVTAVSVLIVWTLVHSVGELLQASADFNLSFELAPDDAHGEYQSTFALGEGVARVIAPALLSVTVLAHGTAAWIALAVLFPAAGLATRAIARATRPPAARGPAIAGTAKTSV